MAKSSTATVIARKPVKELRAKPTGEIVALPTRGKNEPDLVADALIMAAVHTAIADYDRSNKLEGSATQRFAYAIMAKHAHLVRDGASVGPLSLVVGDRKKAGELLLHIREDFIGARPIKPVDDDTAAAMATYLRHSTLLDRSVEFAGVLAKCHAQMTQFNDKTGNWSVPVIRLFPSKPVHTPIGGDPTRMVALDNRGYGATAPNDKGSPKFVTVRASVVAMVKAAKPAPVQTGGRTKAGTGSTDEATTTAIDAVKKMSAEKAANAFADTEGSGMVFLAETLHQLVMGDGGADATLNDIPAKVINVIAELKRHIDTLAHKSDPAKS